jgi:RING finger protein 170
VKIQFAWPGIIFTLNNTFICLIDQLAGSDANKSAIVGKGGMDKLIKLSARYADDPSVLQEVRTLNCSKHHY